MDNAGLHNGRQHAEDGECPQARSCMKAGICTDQSRWRECLGLDAVKPARRPARHREVAYARADRTQRVIPSVRIYGRVVPVDFVQRAAAEHSEQRKARA